MSIKRDINGYKVFDLRGGGQLLWAEKENVWFWPSGKEISANDDDELVRLRKELEEEKEHCTKAIRLLMQVTDTLSFGRTPDRAGAALKQIYKWLEENKRVGQEGEGNQ